MHKQKTIGAGLLIAASAFVVTAGYTKGWGPVGLLNARERLLMENEKPADTSSTEQQEMTDKIEKTNEQ